MQPVVWGSSGETSERVAQPCSHGPFVQAQGRAVNTGYPTWRRDMSSQAGPDASPGHTSDPEATAAWLCQLYHGHSYWFSVPLTFLTPENQETHLAFLKSQQCPKSRSQLGVRG